MVHFHNPKIQKPMSIPLQKYGTMKHTPPKNTEIERKFLVDASAWQKSRHRKNAHRYPIQQGYICSLPERTVRVRIKKDEAYLTIKGPAKNLSRSEFEYLIPKEDAHALLKNMTDAHIFKTRFVFDFEGYTWEIDEFEGIQAPLIIAEVELSQSDEQPKTPPFITNEVSNDMRYTNSQLSKNPFSYWNKPQ